MSYTISQAKEALAQQTMRELQKRLALSEHLENERLVEILHLPYRVIKEQGRLYQERGEMPPNQYYPKNWSTVTPFWEWVQYAHPELAPIFVQDSRFDECIKFMFNGMDNLGEENYTEHYKALRSEYEQAQRAFDDEGKRRYYLARFLQGYDFGSFTAFDFFGNTRHSNKDVEVFRNECIELQADFEKNRDKYFTDYVAVPSKI